MLTTLILLCVSVYILLILGFYVFQDRIVFRPESDGRQHIEQPSDYDLDCHDIHLLTEDGVRIHAWYLPSKSESDWFLLYFHGNNTNLSHQLATLQILHQCPINVLAIDYRGYGASEGRPSESGFYADARVAWQSVQNLGATKDKCLIMGRSLGGGVASYLAEYSQCAGLILESTYTSVPEVGQKRYPFLPVKALIRTQFPTLNRLRRLSCPSLIIHSKADTTIPWDNAVALVEASQCGQLLEIQGAHGDGYLQSGSSYTDGLHHFIQQRMAAHQPSKSAQFPT